MDDDNGTKIALGSSQAAILLRYVDDVAAADPQFDGAQLRVSLADGELTPEEVALLYAAYRCLVPAERNQAQTLLRAATRMAPPDEARIPSSWTTVVATEKGVRRMILDARLRRLALAMEDPATGDALATLMDFIGDDAELIRTFLFARGLTDYPRLARLTLMARRQESETPQARALFREALTRLIDNSELDLQAIIDSGELQPNTWPRPLSWLDRHYPAYTPSDDLNTRLSQAGFPEEVLGRIRQGKHGHRELVLGDGTHATLNFRYDSKTQTLGVSLTVIERGRAPRGRERVEGAIFEIGQAVGAGRVVLGIGLFTNSLFRARLIEVGYTPHRASDTVTRTFVTVPPGGDTANAHWVDHRQYLVALGHESLFLTSNDHPLILLGTNLLGESIELSRVKEEKDIDLGRWGESIHFDVLVEGREVLRLDVWRRDEKLVVDLSYEHAHENNAYLSEHVYPVLFPYLEQEALLFGDGLSISDILEEDPPYQPSSIFAASPVIPVLRGMTLADLSEVRLRQMLARERLAGLLEAGARKTSGDKPPRGTRFGKNFGVIQAVTDLLGDRKTSPTPLRVAVLGVGYSAPERKLPEEADEPFEWVLSFDHSNRGRTVENVLALDKDGDALTALRLPHLSRVTVSRVEAPEYVGYVNRLTASLDRQVVPPSVVQRVTPQFLDFFITPFPEERFDIISCLNTLCYLHVGVGELEISRDDTLQSAYLLLMLRSLEVNGILVISDFPGQLQVWDEALLDRLGVESWRAEYPALDNGHVTQSNYRLFRKTKPDTPLLIEMSDQVRAQYRKMAADLMRLAGRAAFQDAASSSRRMRTPASRGGSIDLARLSAALAPPSQTTSPVVPGPAVITTEKDSDPTSGSSLDAGFTGGKVIRPDFSGRDVFVGRNGEALKLDPMPLIDAAEAMVMPPWASLGDPEDLSQVIANDSEAIPQGPHEIASLSLAMTADNIYTDWEEYLGRLGCDEDLIRAVAVIRGEHGDSREDREAFAKIINRIADGAADAGEWVYPLAREIERERAARVTNSNGMMPSRAYGITPVGAPVASGVLAPANALQFVRR